MEIVTYPTTEPNLLCIIKTSYRGGGKWLGYVEKIIELVQQIKEEKYLKYIYELIKELLK